MDPSLRLLLWTPYCLRGTNQARRIPKGMHTALCEIKFDQWVADAACIQAFVGIQTLYFLNAAVTKISILLLYYRLFGVVQKFRWALWGTSFVVLGYWIACTILAFLGCDPFARNWNKKISGTCVNLVKFFIWNGISNLLIDFLILLLPIPIVWRLSAPTRQKLELSSIFLFGLL